tara:strand:+ start:302 stop:685 length:384 start_codon:yes stop_codon:yes gene_type:complete
MKLIIIKENFDFKRIVFRESKNSIKISYNINFVSMIGITINIQYEYILDKGTFLIVKLKKKDKKLVESIDNFFKDLVINYDNMLINDTIKVKKHSEYTTPKDEKLSVTMNSIKKNTNDLNKVQIFSI